MFTVIIAEKEHIDRIREYDIFLSPFADHRRIALCRWYPEKDTLAEAVPELRETVAREKTWRALILTTGEGLTYRNPFDLVPFEPPQKEWEEPLEEYLPRLRQVKLAAFDAAAEKPLTKLVTHLCRQPLVQAGRNSVGESDPEFAEYQLEAQYKQQLRSRITTNERLDISLPSEVICVARRTYTQRSEEIHSAWGEHVEQQYRRFPDWNLYFDKMRYLVFDLPPENYQSYPFDYLRLLSSLMLLAGQEIPGGCLRPGRLYRLECENDDAALTELLQRYDGKLQATDALLEQKIDAVREEQRPRISDYEAERSFCANVTVPVTPRGDFDKSDLYVSGRELGLSTDCPTDEAAFWDSARSASDKAIHRLIKQPARALGKALESFRGMNRISDRQAACLDGYQVEDVREHIHTEEQAMLDTGITMAENLDACRVRIDKADHQVRRKIDARMTRKCTIAMGLVLLGVFLVGCLPMLVKNLGAVAARGTALGLTAMGLAALALTAVVCLFFLRRALRRKVYTYNDEVAELDRTVTGMMDDYSRCLSHACNVMRGCSVVAYHTAHANPEDARIMVYRKHQSDIRQRREQLRTVFALFFPREQQPCQQEPEAYPYEFDRPVDYEYPIPYAQRQRAIDFLQPDNRVVLPVAHIKGVTVRTEELYD